MKAMWHEFYAWFGGLMDWIVWGRRADGWAPTTWEPLWRAVAGAMVLLAIAGLAIVAWLGIKFVLGLGHDEEAETDGTVVWKAHRPDTEESHYNIVTKMTETTGYPESWLVVLEDEHGQMVKHESMACYIKLKIGDKVKLQWRSNPQWGDKYTGLRAEALGNLKTGEE